ncbi:conserved hypothetical protein [Roseibium sp. TrichSKD4]|nr:conserved hypothetical protein [Roseibium sp. TrichSKD4]
MQLGLNQKIRLNQFALAQLFKIVAIHPICESRFNPKRKGVGNYD